MFERILTALIEIRDVVSIHPVFGVGILLVGSFFLGRLASSAGIPAITGFIIAGMILGPSVSGMVHSDRLRVSGSALPFGRRQTKRVKRI